MTKYRVTFECNEKQFLDLFKGEKAIYAKVEVIGDTEPEAAAPEAVYKPARVQQRRKRRTKAEMEAAAMAQAA